MSKYNKKKSFFEVSKEKLAKSFYDSKIVKFFKKVTTSDQKEKEEFQKEYHFFITKLFRDLIEKVNDSGVAEYLEGPTSNEESDKKGKIKRSFPNIFHPDFSYRFVGDYRITRKSSNERLAYFCSILSKIVYEKFPKIKMYIKEFFLKETSMDKIEILEAVRSTHEKYDTFAIVLKFSSSDLIFVVFRGTKFFSVKDWSTDFEMNYKKIPRKKGSKECYEVHEGFYKSLCECGKDGKSVYVKILELICSYYEKNKFSYENIKNTVVTTGHSLGGGLASLFSISISMNEGMMKDSIHRVFTYGAPRLGDEKYVEIIKDKSFRYINDLDLVPAVPQWMHGHGTGVIVTKVLPSSVQKKIRDNIPLIMFSMYDHFPGEYVQNIAKKYGFKCGKKCWDRNLSELKEDDLKFQRKKLLEEIESLKKQLKKEIEEKNEIIKDNVKLKSIVLDQQKVMKEKFSII